MEIPQKWSLPAVFAVHQRARRALDTLAGLDDVLDALRSAETFLCQECAADAVVLARTRILIGSALGRQGLFEESREWLERSLPHIPESESTLRATALNAYAVALRNLGQVGEAYRIFEELDQAARKSGTARERVRLLTNKANLLQETGDCASALPLRMEALDLCRLVHDTALRCRVLVNLGCDQLELGDFEGAGQSLLEAESEIVGHDDALTRAHVLMLRGRIAFAEDRVTDALAAFGDGIALFGEEPAGTTVARLQLHAAEAHNRLGQPEVAEPLASAASRYFGQAGHRRLWIECVLERARAAAGRGEVERAVALAAEARAAVEDQPDIACALVRLLAELAEKQGDFARALQLLREAEALRERWFSQRTARQVALIKARQQIEALHREDETPATAAERNEELEQKNRELERLHRDKQELLTLIAHDLRNQLGATVNFTELALLTQKPDAHELREQMQTIFSITRSTQELLEHLLSLERVESGRVPVVPEPLELCGWAAALVERSANLGRVKSITATVEGPGYPVVLETDETWLRLAMDNLLTNAFKYASHGSRVVLRIVDEAEVVTLQVEDEGPGIAPEDRPNLFTKFHRTRNQPTGSEFSTGLGLYLVRQYADLLGCDPGFRPRLPRGSIFYLRFPKVPDYG